MRPRHDHSPRDVCTALSVRDGRDPGTRVGGTGGRSLQGEWRLIGTGWVEICWTGPLHPKDKGDP